MANNGAGSRSFKILCTSISLQQALPPRLWQDLSICLRERIHEAMPEKMAGKLFFTNSYLLPTGQSVLDLRGY
jgi:hypothetical protein